MNVWQVIASFVRSHANALTPAEVSLAFITVILLLLDASSAGKNPAQTPEAQP